jgi:hypothetical protein
MKMNRLVLVASLAGLLVACGGGGGGSSTVASADPVAPVTPAPIVVAPLPVVPPIVVAPLPPVEPLPVICMAGQTLTNGVCVSPTPTPVPTPVVSQAVLCAVPHHVYGDIVAPASYTGIFPIPVAAGKLPATSTRGLATKDYNPNGLRQDDPCRDNTLHARNLYVETLDRLQALGVQETWIYNYATWKDFSQPIFTIDPTTMQVKPSEVEFFVSEAKKRNIKVYLIWQFTSVDMKGVQLVEPVAVDSAGLQRIMDSYKQVMIEQAKIGAQIGLAGISADWNCFNIKDIHTTHREQYLANIVALIDEMRKVFPGEITYGNNDATIVNDQILSRIDAHTISSELYLTAEQNQNLTVAMVKAEYMKKIAAAYNTIKTQSTINAPVKWRISVGSKRDFFVTGWTEDGFCVNSCIQKTYITDFSVQAIGLEGQLEALAEQTYFNMKGIDFSASYWFTDDITPYNWGFDPSMNQDRYDFPNLSQSIRNKPAEGILKAWYAK